MPTPKRTARRQPSAAKLQVARERAGARGRAEAMWHVLVRAYPNSRCSLTHANPLELLVATILSAQCTDARVNLVTPALFAACPDAAALAAVSQERLEQLIAGTGLFRNKAKAIRAMAAALVEHHDGQVPDSMEALTALAGVGRKTANVVLGNAYGKNVGVVVDTHVSRLSQRLGLSRQKTPEKIEQDLMALLPQERWTLWSHLMIDHGRRYCRAVSPRCPECPLKELCPSSHLGAAAGA